MGTPNGIADLLAGNLQGCTHDGVDPVLASKVRSNVGISLSPRPDRQITIRAPGFAAAQRFAPASAWALFDGRQDAFGFAALLHGRECGGVIDCLVLHAPGHMQQRMLGTDARIIEAGRNRSRFLICPSVSCSSIE